MPSLHFYNEEVFKEIEKLQNKEQSNEEDLFEEHQFILDCLEMGLTLDNLKELSYVDVLKMMICRIKKFKKSEKPQIKKASQSDWDALAGG